MSVPFKIGDRVKMTQEGMRLFATKVVEGREIQGTVRAVDRDSHQVKVERDGLKVKENWHWKFWEIAE